MAVRSCCACTRKSQCLSQKCSCVREGRCCVSCIPLEMNKCKNVPLQEDRSSRGNSCAMDNSSGDDYDPGPLPSLTDPSSQSSESQAKDSTVPSSSDSPPDSRPSRSSSPSRSSLLADLPPFCQVAEPYFQWNNISGRKCIKLIDKCYDRAVHWIPNLFKVPHGKSGKSFVQELSLLFRAYAEASAKESIALKAAFLFPLLVLQKPFRSSKA
uniref:Tesmin/TSO1-like CXC domain-containing protein n=1 Tax=Amphimedon queenslandica TaxID=400682 RepID=A0A1X7SUI9_AMPQE